jgi:S-adenosylmethionine synthetase
MVQDGIRKDEKQACYRCITFGYAYYWQEYLVPLSLMISVGILHHVSVSLT